MTPVAVPLDTRSRDYLHARCLLVLLVAVCLTAHSSWAATPIPKPAFTNPPTYQPRLNTSAPYSTKPMTTAQDIQRQRQAMQSAVGTGLIMLDVMNSPVSPGPDIGVVGAGMIAKSASRRIVTRQTRLRELAGDLKTPNHVRGWLNQELKNVERGQRTTVRNPRGYDLAHERGREAAKGYDHRFSTLVPRDLHRFKHSIDQYGRRNIERPMPPGMR